MAIYSNCSKHLARIDLQFKMRTVNSLRQWKSSRLGILVLAASSSTSAIIVFLVQLHSAQLRYQLDYEEGNILNAAVRIVRGMTIYPPPHSWPSVMNPYGPIGYEMVSWMVRLGGVDFTLPRYLVMTFAAICCVLIGVIVWKQQHSALAGIAFGALFFGFGGVFSWMSKLRMDLIALAFSLGAICVVVSRRRLWWLSVLLMVAAVFTKHTALAAPAACLVWLWLDGERKLVAKMALLGAALGLCAFAYMQWRTHGTFLFYMTGTHPDLFSWSVYFHHLYWLVQSQAVISTLALVTVVMAIARRKASLALIYLAFAVITAVTVGKAGSAYNHLLELSAALTIAAAVGWSELANASDWKFRFAGTLLVVMLAATYVNNTMHLGFEWRNDEYDRLETYLRNFHGDRVITENLGAAVLAGKTLWISNPFVYTQLVKHGGWSDADLQQQLRKHEVDLVLYEPSQEWSPEFTRALRENYHVEARFLCKGAFQAWVPNSTSQQSR